MNSVERLTAVRDRHAELLDCMTDLFVLLGQLQIFDDTLLRLPRPDAPAPIKRAAARDAGFKREAIDLMALLPYVDMTQVAIDVQNDAGPDAGVNFESTIWRPYPKQQLNVLVMPHTTLGNWTLPKKVRAFNSSRAKNAQPEMKDGKMLCLTRQASHGTPWWYNTENCHLIMTQRRFDLPSNEAVHGIEATTEKSPSTLLRPLMHQLRTLQCIIEPRYGRVCFQTEDNNDDDEPDDQPSCGITNYDQEKAKWALDKLEKTMYGISALYLQSGWDIHAQKTQPHFDVTKFKALRLRYLDEVVNPLIELHIHYQRPDLGTLLGYLFSSAPEAVNE